MFKNTLKIDGMMCSMCEAHINDAIRGAFPEAKKVRSSHIKGESSFISEEQADEDRIREAVGKTGYTLISCSSEVYEKKFFGLF